MQIFVLEKQTRTQTATRLTADGAEDLEGHVSDLLHIEGQEVVSLQDIGGAEPQQLEDDADVAAVLEPVPHPHARTGKQTTCISHQTKRAPRGRRAPTHNLLSSSKPLISSSTVISDLATAVKGPRLRPIFTATCSPLCDNNGR